MARNQTFIDASPEEVFEVLADPDSYGEWVVGSKEIRDAEPEWPAQGSRFHHTVGLGPLTIRDHTSVEELERPRRLVLRAKTRPIGAARVELQLEPEGTGTRVTMLEDSEGGFAGGLLAPAMGLLARGRNVESLRRLKDLAESRAVEGRRARL